VIACRAESCRVEERVPATDGVEHTLSVDVGAEALAVHTLGVDQLVVLENHLIN
jgi:hypothetical protein